MHKKQAWLFPIWSPQMDGAELLQKQQVHCLQYSKTEKLSMGLSELQKYIIGVHNMTARKCLKYFSVFLKSLINWCSFRSYVINFITCIYIFAQFWGGIVLFSYYLISWLGQSSRIVGKIHKPPLSKKVKLLHPCTVQMQNCWIAATRVKQPGNQECFCHSLCFCSLLLFPLQISWMNNICATWCKLWHYRVKWSS